jgi:hypothetical protein
VPTALRTPPAPASLAYLLQWFAELASARAGGLAEPPPLGWQELHAWCTLTLRELKPWEAQALRALDTAWLQAWRAGQADGQPATAAAPAKQPGR